MQDMTKRFASLTMSRRRLITATVGTGVALSAMATFSRSATAADEHAGHGDHMMMHDDAAHHQPLIDAALACVNRGDVFLDHCFKLLGKGDTSMKTCVRTVSAMLPMCAALARFAALDAPRLKGVGAKIYRRLLRLREAIANVETTTQPAAHMRGRILRRLHQGMQGAYQG